MINQFSFENFKSFKDEVTLDFIAESLTEHKEHLIETNCGDDKLLPVVVIYGPNGGGKSTVLEALTYLASIVLNKVIALKVLPNEDEESNDINKIKKILSSMELKDKYHKFCSTCRNEPIKFDILFEPKKDVEFRYQLNVLHNEIVEENLYMKTCSKNSTQIIFERNINDFYLGELLEGVTIEKVKNSMPILSHIAINYDIPVIDIVVRWFFDMQFLDYDNPRLDKRFIFPKDRKKQKVLFDMLKEMDINVMDIRVEKDSEGNIIEVYTKHLLSNDKTVEIPFTDESSGTRKLFSFLPQLIECLDKGGVLIADEMDAKLHPKLIRYTLELFTSPKSNKKGAQLILTSHDMYTLSSEILRRDEIWFCALNIDNASILYSLSTFKKENGEKPRNDEKYSKQYLEGRYGADPYLRRILDWGSKNE